MKPDHIAHMIETRRLVLRRPVPGDGAALFEAVRESLSSLRAWPTSLPWARHEPSISASENFCLQAFDEFDTGKGLAFLIFDRNRLLLGSIALHGIRWEIPAMETGFWMRDSAQRQGYAGEALRAVTRFAFSELGARRIQARTNEDNAACRATCESAGMALEGILRNERITPAGQLKNGCVYGVIPDIRNIQPATAG